ncbi:MAG: hypothetical protein ACC707_12790 [Thiohalomonadales bacterium]
MFFRFIPILIAVAPILAINICYLIAASFEHVAWCFPYLDGCTSISATGRHAPENFIYRATMLPIAVFMGLYWVLNYYWLIELGDRLRWPRLTILFLGVIAAFFLVLYTTVLGAIGDIYQTQRRIGVTIYFSFTYLSQLLITSRLWHLKKKRGQVRLGRVPEAQLLLCSAMLLLGLISIPLSVVEPQADNIIEWNFALLLSLYYLTTYYGWKNTGFELKFFLNTP